MTKINIEAFKKEGFSFEEIESIKRWIDDVENWRTVSYKEVKKIARENILSKQKVYA